MHDANLEAIFNAGDTEVMTGGSVMSREGGLFRYGGHC